jgi:hypothetical protein
MPRFVFALFLTCLGLIALAPSTALGQVDRATLSGTIRDTSGGVVADADVVAVAPETGLVRESRSGPDGVYRLAGLPIGRYSVTVSKPGFETVVLAAVGVSVGDNLALDATLTVGTVSDTVEVVATASLVNRSSAEIGSVVSGTQIQNTPLNGRNWASLMTLAPGAVNTGDGSQGSIRFFGRARDDNNWSFDGVDATGIKDPRQEAALRLVMSTEAIAEFRVSSSNYTAEGGTGAGAQVNLVSRSGTNTFRGSAFLFVRDDAFDARRVQDPNPGKPEFSLYQGGGSLGGPIVRNRTFFFATYEGLRQELDVANSRPALVPSQRFRDLVAATQPALTPVLNAYPTGTRSTANPNVDEFFGRKTLTWDEDSYLLRVDHRLSTNTTLFGRYNRVLGLIDSEVRSDLLETRASDVSPWNLTVQAQHVFTPTLIGEVKYGQNRSPLERTDQGLDVTGFEIRNTFTPTRATVYNEEKPSSYSYLGNLTWTRGAHTVKSGGEFRQIHVDVSNSEASSVRWNSTADFLANRTNRIRIDGELPLARGRRWYGLGYVQDEWRVAEALTLNAGLRYEYYSVMNEADGRGAVFDLERCPPTAESIFCAPGTDWYFPDSNNLGPRLSATWSPVGLGGRTVFRGGYGIYYSTGQNDDVMAAIDSLANRGELLTPASYPIEPYIPQVLGGANPRPRALQRDRRDMYSHTWTASVQQELGARYMASAAYVGSRGFNAFNRIFVNTIDLATNTRPAAPYVSTQIDRKSRLGETQFDGLQLGLQRRFSAGFLLSANYMLGDSTDNNAGNGEGSEWMISGCGACEQGPSDFDVRHSFAGNFVYELPYGPGRAFGGDGVVSSILGGWDLSGVVTARSGRPFSVSVNRTAPDGNDVNQRASIVPGVEPVPGNAPNNWLNLAAFSIPAANEFGNSPRNGYRAPGLWQIDLSLSKRTRIAGNTAIDLRVDVFNVLNEPQYGLPARNRSEPQTFGILAPANDGPTGTGTSRQLQFSARLTF